MAGTSHASDRRNRDYDDYRDDRSRRDYRDDRGGRRRDERDRADRDHYRGRDRDDRYDRRYEDSHYRSRRDRSRERERERDRPRDRRSRSPASRRDRSPAVRDRRERDRDDERRERTKTPQAPAKSALSEEEERKRRQAEKLEKLEAWKKAKEAEKAAKESATSSPRTPAPSSFAKEAAVPPAASAKAATPPPTKLSFANGINKTNGSVKSGPLKPMSAFGITKAAPAPALKIKALVEEEETAKRRKLEKLPEMEPITSDATPANVDQEDEADDTEMPDAPIDTNEADEVDPLDAFMAGLEAEDEPAQDGAQPSKPKGELFLDDDDERDAVNEDAMGDLLSIQAKKHKRNEIAAIDWDKEKLEPFKKNFYVQTSQLSEEQVKDFLAKDNIKIKAKETAPQPCPTWSFGFSALIMDTIKQLGFDAPTPIQSVAIPTLMSGRDAICIAQTGSGKTIAYLLPLLRIVLHAPPLTKFETGPIALVIAPTRELAFQVSTAAKPFAKALNLRVAVAYGGQSIAEQIADLKRGAQILVGTPGRLIELLSLKKLSLKQCRALIIDEADRCLDLGFQPQLDRIRQVIRPDKMTALFSATFNDKMQFLAMKMMRFDPVEIIVGGRSTIPPQVEVKVEVLNEDEKLNKLLGILGILFEVDEDARALIFVEQQSSAEKLLNVLMKKSYPCDAIHGNRDQLDRISAISDFRSGAIPILIATSVAARGLDIEQLKVVVNYDVPHHGEDFVHRIGRTGRAGRTGVGYCFITPEEDMYAPDIVKVLKESKKEVPEDLKKLAEGFKEKVKKGEAQPHYGGFGGHGLDKLDSARTAERSALRKAYGGEDEPETEEEKKAKEEESKKKTEEIMRKIAPERPNAAAAPRETKPDDDRFKIVVHKRATPEAEEVKKPSTAVDKVEEARAKINARLSRHHQLRPGQPIDNKGPDAGAYHATLEINDFSQKARWAATNRSNIVKLLENGRVSITNKGSYFPPGKQPDPLKGEQKLYILVEGETEADVMAAMQHLVELLKAGEEADAMAASKPGGRYVV